MCNHDHNAIDQKFAFCPYCGQPLGAQAAKPMVDGAAFTPNNDEPPTEPSTWQSGYISVNGRYKTVWGRLPRNFRDYVEDNLNASNIEEKIISPYHDILDAQQHGMGEYFTLRQLNRYVSPWSYNSLEKLRNLGVIYCVGKACYGVIRDDWDNDHDDSVNVYALVPNHADVVKHAIATRKDIYHREMEDARATLNSIIRRIDSLDALIV